MILIAALFFRSGLHLRDPEVAKGLESLDLFGIHITDPDIVTLMPIGAALIILHAAIHIAIDADYLVRGKLPPERARSGH
jgi:hypothetical protein